MNSAQKMRAARAARKVDEMLHEAFDAVHRQPGRFVALYRLVARVRSVSNLIGPFLDTGYVGWIGTDAILRGLVNLSEFHQRWLRPIEAWQPASLSRRREFSSLARHLLATHHVPRFMDYVWMDDSPSSVTYRRWFRHLALGNNIRGILGHGDNIAKSAASRFMLAPDHLTIDQALRWCLSATREVNASQSAYPASPSRRRLKRMQAQRTRPKHHDIWPRVDIDDFFYFQQEPLNEARSWFIRQIRNPHALVAEGTAMRHCVATYCDACERGWTTIWSMQSKSQYARNRVLTIEVAPRTKTIVTALGCENRSATAHERGIMARWADREGMTISRRLA